MKIQRLVTWPFAAFLLNYGLPSSDPTVRTASDIILSSLLIGVVWGAILGLPLALLFRKGDQALSRDTFLVMGVTFVATTILDLQGWGFLGAVAYIYFLRRSPARRETTGPPPQ